MYISILRILVYNCISVMLLSFTYATRAPEAAEGAQSTVKALAKHGPEAASFGRLAMGRHFRNLLPERRLQDLREVRSERNLV